MADDKPVIIIKKKGGHGGHHGGAWKVAYADFVTAMMAFFMVMWLVNSAASPVKQSIASYFRKPGIFDEGSGTPLMTGEAGILSDAYVPPHPEDTMQPYPGKSKELLLNKTGTDSTTSGDKRITYKGDEGQRDSVPDDDASQRGFQSEEPDNPTEALNLAMRKLQKKDQILMEEIKQAIAQQKGDLDKAAEELKDKILAAPELQELLGKLDVKVDNDGLSIEIMDTEKSSMFQSGSAQILPQAESAFSKIAPILAKLPNTIDIIGHTDSKGFGRPGGYSNWELSADRANAARRLLEKGGIPVSRIASVSGRADKELKIQADPLAAGNRRITLKVRFNLPAKPQKSVEGPTTSNPPAEIEPTAPPDAKVEPTEPSIATPIPLEDQAPRKSDPTTFNQPAVRRKDRVKLPDGPVPTENPAPSGKDKIFGNNPVVGPVNPFSNLD